MTTGSGYPIDPYATSREDAHPIVEDAPKIAIHPPSPLIRWRVDGPFLQYWGTDPVTGEEAWAIIDHWPPMLCQKKADGTTEMPPYRRDPTVEEAKLDDQAAWPKFAAPGLELPPPPPDDPRIT